MSQRQGHIAIYGRIGSNGALLALFSRSSRREHVSVAIRRDENSGLHCSIFEQQSDAPLAQRTVFGARPHRVGVTHHGKNGSFMCLYRPE